MTGMYITEVKLSKHITILDFILTIFQVLQSNFSALDKNCRAYEMIGEVYLRIVKTSRKL